MQRASLGIWAFIENPHRKLTQLDLIDSANENSDWVTQVQIIRLWKATEVLFELDGKLELHKVCTVAL